MTVVVSGEQAHDKARGAVAALGTARLDHRRLHGMELIGGDGLLDKGLFGNLALGDAVGSEDLPPGHRPEGNQAAIHRLIVGLAIGPGANHGHGTGPTVAVAAAFLGARPPTETQVLQQGHRGGNILNRD